MNNEVSLNTDYIQANNIYSRQPLPDVRWGLCALMVKNLLLSMGLNVVYCAWNVAELKKSKDHETHILGKAALYKQQLKRDKI